MEYVILTRKEKLMDGKVAMVCNTPYQILTAINMLVNKVEDISHVDLFVIDCFSNSKNTIANLIKSKLFDNIIVCKPKTVKANKFRTFFDLCNTSKLLNRYEFSDTNFLKYKYKTLFVGDGNELGICIHKINRCEIIAFDDGAISYVGNCFQDNIGILYRVVGRLLKIGVFSYKINKIYVNCKEACNSKIETIEQLPLINNENCLIKYANEIFGFGIDSKLKNYRYILLDQVLSEKKGFNGKELNILYDENLVLREKGIVRKHPRKENINIDSNKIACDTVKNMWELETMRNISPNNVLIGAGSTAQITPKMISNKEPYIIFTYLLFFEKNEEFFQIAKMITNMYEDKTKIFIPKNLEEFNNIINLLEQINCNCSEPMS